MGKKRGPANTMFSRPKKFIGVPADDAAGESVPAPLDDAGNNLTRPVSFGTGSIGGGG
jgi:hypothetical protein